MKNKEQQQKPAFMTAEEIWKAACKAQMDEVYSNIGPDGNTNRHAIKHWTKTPEMPVEFAKAEKSEGIGMSEYKIESTLDELLIKRGEHKERVRNPIYSEERQLAKDLFYSLSSKPAALYNDEEIKDALQKLVHLKESKDRFGKTEVYIEEQKIAWENARKALISNPNPAVVVEPNEEVVEKTFDLYARHYFHDDEGFKNNCMTFEDFKEAIKSLNKK